jgi:hypothetical protein
MNNEQVARLIEEEFLTKTLGTTEQYLKIHQPMFEVGKLKIDRVDRESEENLIIAYLPVKDEYFYLAVYIDTIKKEIFNVGSESRNTVYFRAESEIWSANHLQTLTRLQPTAMWNNGDVKANKRSFYDFNCIEFNPNPEADKFEDKLEKLLIFLQQDVEGVKALAANTNAFIQVIMDFHAGNQILGSAGLSSKHIQILSNLNLAIYFDINAWGEPFK